MSTFDLFDGLAHDAEPVALAPGAWLLKGYALTQAPLLLDGIQRIDAMAPFRHQTTPGGFRMSAAMTSCGELGWVTDRSGYRYTSVDPETGRCWPAMPEAFCELARKAADSAGYPGFDPQGCLINRYATGARMSLHQDKDEDRLEAPIVSVSLGAPIVFLFGGPNRTDPVERYRLEHGDVVIWGGPSRLFFHGVAPLGRRAVHPATGAVRYNLTFRRVR